MKEIILSKKFKALVDDECFELLNQWKWSASINKNKVYAERKSTINGISKKIKMHRLILGIKNPKLVVDHIDGNGLNNQKCNLRICSIKENSCNRNVAKNKKQSKYLGVHLNYNKWYAQIRHNKKLINIGPFETDLDAAKAYNNKAIELHGEFANLNQLS